MNPGGGTEVVACQVVYEERFIGKYNIPPLQAVGWEGIFGFGTLGLLLIPVRKMSTRGQSMLTIF